jgi:hypothetical protein
VAEFLRRARSQRGWNLFVANLRILLGFAFVPAGLKKLLAQPFTDPANVGTFHEFLHAFHATGLFYQFVGAIQLTIAVLLMTQVFALPGALMAVPVFTAITVFCWSTQAYFTAVMATLMLLATAALVLWDYARWRDILRPADGTGPRAPDAERAPPIDLSLWKRCGSVVLLIYLAVCAQQGGIYRPRGVELGNPAFYILPLIAMFPLVTYLIERARRRTDPS